MRVMKTLTALTLSAAIVPAMALSTSAFAQSSGEMEMEMEAAAEQHSGAMYMSSKPAGAMYGNEIIGKSVRSRGSDETIGSIRDLVVNADGQILGVVLTTSTFLGLGGQEVGLSWDQLQHGMDGNESMFFVDMDAETLRNAPPLQ